jgi:potassium efflux system protein
MRTRIAICTCAVAMMLVTACSLSEAADRNKLGSGDPKAPSPKTSGIQKPAVSQTAQAIPLEEVPVRAEGTRAELNTLLPAEASRQMLKRIGSELDHALPEVTSRLAKTREVLAGRPSVRTLQMLEAELSEMRKRLRPWDEELDRQLTGLHVVFQRLDTIAAVWDATAAEVSRREGAATSTVARIATVLGEIDQARSAVVKWRNQILAVRDRILDQSSALANSLGHVQSATEVRLQKIFQADRPPLWSPQVRASLRKEWKAGEPQQFLQWLQESGQYVREQGHMLGFQLALFVALGLGLRALRDRARARAEDDYNLRDAKEVFERPWAMALLIALILTAWQHPLAPLGAGLVPAVLAAAAVLRIGRRFLVPALAPLTLGLLVFFAIDRARDFLDTMPTLERVVFLMEMVGVLGFLFWLLRPSRIANIPAQLRGTPFLRLLGVAMRVAAAVVAIAIVADLFGWVDLASMLGGGVERAGYLGFFVFVLLKVFQSLATFALVLWPLRLLRAISGHRMLVRRRLERVLSVIAVGLWATLLFGQLGLLGPAQAAVARMLRAGVSVGALSVSVGDVMAFALTVWLSFLLARLVDFVLQEDVFTRVRTGRGVPYAISGLVRYTLIFLGLLVALSAAGVELSKLTVIVGGLGVGIGFGLQNVVNNFVSGLILLFERPIQVGDSVQLPDAWGKIKRIGIRTSVIRSFDGADVIVPNGMLISDKVTNWTLSDQRRRIEVDVGVNYGTPAQRVIDLLVGVAKANPGVIKDPEPQAYFLNFGDNALEFKLRVWVEVTDRGYSIRSELAVAVQEALEHAGIGVPFPQRDLHLVSVSPNAAPYLGTATQPSPRPNPTSASDEGS